MSFKPGDRVRFTYKTSDDNVYKFNKVYTVDHIEGEYVITKEHPLTSKYAWKFKLVGGRDYHIAYNAKNKPLTKE